jgi:hypothetical protein
MSDDDVASRANTAMYRLLEENPPFLMDFTSEEKYKFNWEIEFRYRADIRGAFRRELYLVASNIQRF